MKLLAKGICFAALAAMMAGCASNSVYVPKVPAGVQQAILDYEAQPDNKVFILAVDPSGDYAYAYEYGKATLKEAAKIAVENIDAQRKANGVVARPYVYMLNDKVVWSEMIRGKSQAGIKTSADKAPEMSAEAGAADMEEAAEAETMNM